MVSYLAEREIDYMFKLKRTNDNSPIEPISLISNVLLAIGVLISVFVLAKAYLFSGELPAGTCPLTLNRPWLYGAIALLLLSLILSFFEPKKQKDRTP